MAEIFVSNSHTVDLKGLKDFPTDAYINDATVTVTLVDAAGTEVAGQTWPATMAYVSASAGEYQGGLEGDLTITNGDQLVAKVTSVKGTSQGHWEIPVEVKVRPG